MSYFHFTPALLVALGGTILFLLGRGKVETVGRILFVAGMLAWCFKL